MGDVSRVLCTARERAGLSLEELSARTKIKLTFLQAIERGEFERLPGEFFTRAFLRTYAREIHLSPDAIVEEYDAAHRAAEPTQEEVRDSVRQPGSETARASWFERGSGERSRLLGFDPASRERARSLTQSAEGSVWPVFALAVILVAVLFVATRPDPGDANELGAVGTTGVEAAEVAPAGARPEPDPEPEPEMLAIEIRPSGDTWIEATADGDLVVYRLLQPGDHVMVEARDALAVRVGNAAAFEYSINGMPGKPLGDEGDVRNIQITRENHRTFRR